MAKNTLNNQKKKISLGNKGKYVSNETRQKLSKIKSKPNGRVGKLSPLSKSICQIDKNTMEVVNTFESIRQAEIYINGKPTGAIKNCLYGKSKSAYGYYWDYAITE